jgi:hypothetical protein
VLKAEQSESAWHALPMDVPGLESHAAPVAKYLFRQLPHVVEV